MKHSFLITLMISAFTAANLAALPSQVILIRHAEKPPQGNELSLKGRERAAAFVPYFVETANLIANGTPTAIYAMNAPKPDSSQRPIQTVTPLAEKLQIKIKSTFERDNYKKMVEEIKADTTLNGRTVLICWEHSLIPEIARAFGALQTPGRWSGDVYDRTWLITLAPNGKTSFQNLPQRLMFGDTYN